MKIINKTTIGESHCVHLVDGICEMLTDDTVKQPCIEGPCIFTEYTVKLEKAGKELKK